MMDKAPPLSAEQDVKCTETRLKSAPVGIVIEMAAPFPVSDLQFTHLNPDALNVLLSSKTAPPPVFRVMFSNVVSELSQKDLVVWVVEKVMRGEFAKMKEVNVTEYNARLPKTSMIDVVWIQIELIEEFKVTQLNLRWPVVLTKKRGSEKLVLRKK